MATELYTNNTTTTVSSGGTTAPSGGTQESWTVASSASFPAASTGSSQFHVADQALPAEKILVTNVSGTTWTVTRGAESTTPVAHTAGFTVVQVVTAGVLTGLTAAAFGTAPALGISFGTLPGIWAAVTGSQVPAQELLVSLAAARESVTITKLATWIGGAGVTPGAGINGLAIYSEAGALLGQTGDMTTAFQAANSYAQAALTASVPVTAGTNYYLAFLHNFTGTQPAVPGFVPPPGGVPVINGHILHGFLAAQASFPASFTPGGLGNGQHWYWVTASV